MRKAPDKNCTKCDGRGVYLRSNGKIPVIPDQPPCVPKSEPLINCPCTIVWEEPPFCIKKDYLLGFSR